MEAELKSQGENPLPTSQVSNPWPIGCEGTRRAAGRATRMMGDCMVRLRTLGNCRPVTKGVVLTGLPKFFKAAREKGCECGNFPPMSIGRVARGT